MSGRGKARKRDRWRDRALDAGPRWAKLESRWVWIILAAGLSTSLILGVSIAAGHGGIHVGDISVQVGKGEK